MKPITDGRAWRLLRCVYRWRLIDVIKAYRIQTGDSLRDAIANLAKEQRP